MSNPRSVVACIPDDEDSGKSHVSIVAHSWRFKQTLKEELGVVLPSRPRFRNKNNNNNTKNRSSHKQQNQKKGHSK